MQKHLTIFCILLSMLSFAQTGSPGVRRQFEDPSIHRKAAIGKPFPSFKAKTEGLTLNNDSLKGKVVFINFWFERCPPCIAEFEGLNQLYEKLKDSADFEFISFTFETPKRIEKMREKYGMKYKIFSIKDSECFRLNQGNGYPTTIILDRNQKIKHLLVGGNRDKERATKHLMDNIYPLVLKEL